MTGPFVLIMSGLILVGMVAFVVFAIRNRPDERRGLDRDTEMGNAQIRAWGDHTSGMGPY